MNDLTLDYRELTEICESREKECHVQYQKAKDKGDLETALRYLTAEAEISETLTIMLRRIRDRQAIKIGEEIMKRYEESA